MRKLVPANNSDLNVEAVNVQGWFWYMVYAVTCGGGGGGGGGGGVAGQCWMSRVVT